jgi:hypothetical protein
LERLVPLRTLKFGDIVVLSYPFEMMSLEWRVVDAYTKLDARVVIPKSKAWRELGNAHRRAAG